MSLRKGQKVEIHQRSQDESWEDFMDGFLGLHGIITDPDASINDPDDLVEVSIVGKGTFPPPPGTACVCLKTDYPVPWRTEVAAAGKFTLSADKMVRPSLPRAVRSYRFPGLISAFSG